MLHYLQLPPTINLDNQDPECDLNCSANTTTPYSAEFALSNSFGFGGTNFHVAIEGFDHEYHTNLVEQWKGRWEAYSGKEMESELTPSMTHDEIKSVEGGILLISGSDIHAVKSKLESVKFSGPNFDDDPNGMRLSFTLPKHWSFSVSDNVRLALIATSWQEFEKRHSLALKTMTDEDKQADEEGEQQ